MFEVGQQIRFNSMYGNPDDGKLGTIVKIYGGNHYFIYLPEGEKHKKVGGRVPTTMIKGIRTIFTWQCSASYITRVTINKQMHFQFKD